MELPALAPDSRAAHGARPKPGTYRGTVTLRPQAVLLDAGGVLVLPDSRVTGPVVRSAGGRTDSATLRRAHYAGMAGMDAARGSFAAYCSAYLVACSTPRAGVADAADELTRQLRHDHWIEVVPGAVEALRRLGGTGVTLAVVSNAGGAIAEMLATAGVCQVGDGPCVVVHAVADSTVVGSEKPDPAIFRHALDAIGVAPEDAVHVGDSLHADVGGALAAGVHPIHLDPYDDCPVTVAAHQHVHDLAEVPALLGW